MRKLIDEARMLLGASDAPDTDKPDTDQPGNFRNNLPALIAKLRKRYQARDQDQNEPQSGAGRVVNMNTTPSVQGWVTDR